MTNVSPPSSELALGRSVPSSAAIPPERTERAGRAPSRVPGPTPQSAPSSGSAAAGSGSGFAPVIFFVLLLSFALAIPNAGRWLRPDVALRLSPAYVAPGDRPG